MKHCLECDNNGHWYVIPTQHRMDWDKWLISESWDVPEWAIRVDGAGSVTFDDWCEV